jgi:hypothetical protein
MSIFCRDLAAQERQRLLCLFEASGGRTAQRPPLAGYAPAPRARRRFAQRHIKLSPTLFGAAAVAGFALGYLGI